MTTFSSEQLNFFKFSTVVFEEFPIALRQVFAHLWDTLVAPLPGFKKWDDSLLVRNLFLNKEGGKTRYVPTSKSYHDWDCTALFEATLYSKSCSVSDGKGGFATLAKMYVTPRGVPHGLFHPSVLSPSGNNAETYALALDQLRRLRNTLCHQNSTKEIVKADFDNYIHLAKEAFRALKLNSTKIDAVGRLGEKDFPTARLQQLEDELRAERFKPIEDILDKMRFDGTEIKRDVIDVKTKVEDVETEVKTVVTVLKETVKDVQTKMEDVGSDVKTAATDVQKKMEDVGSNVKEAVTDLQKEVEDVRSEVKTAVTDMQTKMEDVGSDVKAAVTDMQNKMEDVGSDVKRAVTDVQTKVRDFGSAVKRAVTDVQTKMKDVGSDVKTAVTDVKATVTDVQTKMEDIRSDMKTAVTDMQTKVEDVGSDVKAAVTDVETKVENVRSDVKAAVTDVKAAVTDVQTKVEDVGWGVKAAVTDVQTKVEDVRSDVKRAVRDFSLNINLMREAMQERVLEGFNAPQSCIPDKIPNFVGRQEECKEIQNHLTEGNTRIINVWGPPAFGKTSVAINVAHQLREKNIPVYFLPLRGMTSKEELVSKLLSMFADDNQVPHTSPSHWLIRKLQKVQNQQNPFILIWDNADDLLESEDGKERVVQFIHEILAQCSHIKFLLTTRASLDFLSLTNSVHLTKINVLDEVSSASLIKLLLPDVTDDNCKCIVQECGQVPLAMRLMCNIMKEEHTSINELSEELRNSTLVNVLDDESFPADVRLKILISKSFQRLPIQERRVFVSLTVFRGWFNTKEATAVLDVKTNRTTTKVIRSLERNSLINCGESFSRFTIHSLFRSFVEEQRRNDKTIEVVFHSAQRRFNDYYISSLTNANEKFLMGPSNEAWEIFAGRRENILLSITDGIKDDDLYPKIVNVLSTAELFLFAVLPEEEVLFSQIYDTALLEAKRRHVVEDERMLFAAKSFRYWGWFSLDCRTWEDSLNFTFSNTFACPAKLLCYQGVYEILRGNRDVGLTSIFSALVRLNDRSDEVTLKTIVFIFFALLGADEGEMLKDTRTSEHLPALLNECGSCFKARFSRFLHDEVLISPVDALKSIFRDKDLLFLNFISNLFKRYLYAEHMEESDMTTWEANAFLNAVSTFIPTLFELKYGKNISNLPVEVILYKAVLSKPLETAFLTFLDEDMCGTFLNRFANQADFARLCFQEFTDQVMNNGVDSVQSYNAANQFMKSLLFFCDEINENWGKSLDFRDGYLVNLIKFISDAIDNVLTSSSRRVPDTDVLELARSYDNLGKLKHHFVDNRAALASYQQAMRLREEHAGNHIDSVKSQTDIGCIHFKMGNATQADRAFQRALDVRKQLNVYDHEDTASIYILLAEKHYTLGNLKTALDAQLKALKIRKEHLGQHRLTAKTFHEAGKLCFELQSYRDALQFCEQALNMRLDLLGEVVDTAESFHLMGQIHSNMHEHGLAVLYFEKAAPMRSILLGIHEDTACSYHNLGLAQHSKGDPHDALDSIKKAADMRSKLLGKHKDTASSYHCLGVVQCGISDLQGALASLRKAADMRSEKLSDHKDTASSYHWLGFVCHEIGDLQEALVCLQEAAYISDLLGEHKLTARSYHWLGVVQHDLRDFPGALASLQKAADMRSKRLGDHKDTASSYHLLGIIQRDMGEDFHAASATLQKAAIMRFNLLGVHEDTANSYHNLGAVQYLMGDLKKSLDFLQTAAHMRSNLPGDHKDTASTYHLLGSVQYDMKDIDNAVESLQKAWKLRDELLGEHHHDTVDTLQLLSRACEASLLRG